MRLQGRPPEAVVAAATAAFSAYGLLGSIATQRWWSAVALVVLFGASVTCVLATANRSDAAVHGTNGHDRWSAARSVQEGR